MTARVPASDNTGLYGGVVLGLSAIAALIVANSPFGPDYEALLRTTGEVRIGSIGLSKTVDHWINDGLMAVFFLMVGLEIKREAIEGPLSSAKQAALPVIAAFGDLCRGELGRRPRIARLGHPGGDRHRLCTGCLRHAGTQGPGFAEGLSHGARDH